MYHIEVTLTNGKYLEFLRADDFIGIEETNRLEISANSKIIVIPKETILYYSWRRIEDEGGR